MSPRYFLGAAFPLALVGIVTAANAPAPAAPETTWRAVVVHGNGSSDIVDYGLTLDDCEAVLIGYPDALERICEREPAARLIGHGCQGASGPLYAIDESDFPICERIERL